MATMTTLDKNKENLSSFDPTARYFQTLQVKGSKGNQIWATNQLKNYVNPKYDPNVQTDSGTGDGTITNRTGTQVATNPYDAIAAQKEKALQQQRDAQNLQITQQSDISRATLGGQSQANARNLAEYLAQRGLTSSGTAAQGEINRLGTLQQGIGALEQQKANALTGVETQYQSGLATAQEEALAQAQAQEKERMASAIATIGAYGQDYQAEINKRMAVNPNDPLIPYLQMARQEKLTGIAKSTAEQKQQDFENQLDLQKYNLSVANANRSGSGNTVNPFRLTSSEVKAKMQPNKNLYEADGVTPKRDAAGNILFQPVELTPREKGRELAKMSKGLSPEDYRGYADYYGAVLPIDEIQPQLDKLGSSSRLQVIQSMYNQKWLNDAEANYLLTKYGLQ